MTEDQHSSIHYNNWCIQSFLTIRMKTTLLYMFFPGNPFFMIFFPLPDVGFSFHSSSVDHLGSISAWDIWEQCFPACWVSYSVFLFHFVHIFEPQFKVSSFSVCLLSSMNGFRMCSDIKWSNHGMKLWPDQFFQLKKKVLKR